MEIFLMNRCFFFCFFFPFDKFLEQEVFHTEVTGCFLPFHIVLNLAYDVTQMHSFYPFIRLYCICYFTDQ